jgi:hypothetical protein
MNVRWTIVILRSLHWITSNVSDVCLPSLTLKCKHPTRVSNSDLSSRQYTLANSNNEFCVFQGITILLSLSVFELIVAEMVPTTSMAVPLIGERVNYLVHP